MNSTHDGFDCSAFDRINSTSSGNNPYLCRASAPGETKDTANHSTHVTFTTGVIIGIVIVGVALVVGAIFVFFLVRWFLARRRRAAGSAPGPSFLPRQQQYGHLPGEVQPGYGQGAESHEMNRPNYGGNNYQGPPPVYEHYRPRDQALA
jgi:hypothetical protein